MIVSIVRDENYYVVGVGEKYIRVGKQHIPDPEDINSIVNVFSIRLSDDDAIKIIKELKAERDLISFGLSLSGENLTSDRITEIDRIISKLSERFISS